MSSCRWSTTSSANSRPRAWQTKNPQTLQATALVHEAYLRLVDVDQAQHWNSRAHFFAAAAEAMRRILVENARRKKSGGRHQRLSLADADLPTTVTEAAKALGVSRTTAFRHWTYARAWLRAEFADN